MEEESTTMPSTSLLVAAASEFASYPGLQADVSVKEFLDRFPLHFMLSVLQTEAGAPEVEGALVPCLERIFNTKYGSSLIPKYMDFVRIGLQKGSQSVRCLACKTVSCLLENVDEGEAAVQLLKEYDVYPLVLDCLIDGDEQVAAAAADAVQNLAKTTQGTEIVFPITAERTHFRNIVLGCSSMARMRVLALIVKLFSSSAVAARAIYSSDLLSLIEAEINNADDMLMILGALELLYELAESPNALKFFSRTKFLQLLISTISNTSVESVVRSRAISICGRLFSSEDMFMVCDESSIKAVLLAIDQRLELLKGQESDECECALEALGQIGSSIQGAVLLLLQRSPVARHVVEAAFDQQRRGEQLAALHALADICGSKRLFTGKLLNTEAEECLRLLIYEVAANCSKLTPSGLLLSVLQQDSAFRLAAYRMIAALVARSWCLMEICSKPEIVDIVTSPQIETNKNGMDARFECCTAINKAFLSSPLPGAPAFSGIASKLQEAVRRGPYLAKERIDAQPMVITADRF